MFIKIREKYERELKPVRIIEFDQFDFDVRTKTLHIVKGDSYFTIDHIADIYCGDQNELLSSNGFDKDK